MQVNHGNFTGHAECFIPLKEGEQVIVTSFNDITPFAHTSGRGYIQKAHTNLWGFVWVFGTKWFSQLLGGH